MSISNKKTTILKIFVIFTIFFVFCFLKINKTDAADQYTYVYTIKGQETQWGKQYSTIELCKTGRDYTLMGATLISPTTPCQIESTLAAYGSRSTAQTDAQLAKYTYKYTPTGQATMWGDSYDTIELCNVGRTAKLNTLSGFESPTTACALRSELLNPTTPGATATETNYTLLAPLPGLDKTFDTSKSCVFGTYMNIIIKLLIGISAVLAMIMIIKGGFEYMTSSLPSEKESGKGSITQAILGLMIALGAWVILYTLNPNLLNFCLTIS